ncbi:methyltransferase domain-containing protein [uncultured Paludibaculum sp.]|uniref:SAM-dependent methyltransferase n=1 Tax=uncultured Paludibaculum sp. TaxID=1765020 RepID=UPI002AAAC3AE|nr:methyltransferase domain-containing protein [uncultured Paludibaculum sp.]
MNYRRHRETSSSCLLLAASLLGGGACKSRPALEFGSGLDVPYVQTAPGVVTAMLHLAGVHPGDVVMDLGCGDGRIAIAAAREFGAEGIGYDIDPERIAEARQNAIAAGVNGHTQFFRQNFFQADISRASVITVFLMPALLEQFRPHFLHSLAPGTRIVSHSFPLRDWPEQRKLVVEGRTLYLYRVGQAAADSQGR